MINTYKARSYVLTYLQSILWYNNHIIYSFIMTQISEIVYTIFLWGKLVNDRKDHLILISN